MSENFEALFRPLQRELHAYAYRMLGGFHDADDALQDSQLKAWRAFPSFDGSNFRAWIYRIVTNTCLDLLKARARRFLPQDLCAPVAPGPPANAPRSDLSWIEPYPDHLLPDHTTHLRESIRLAFIHLVQNLPPRQRAALLLHDVLEWSVADVAAILETTDAAINSALQRARAAIARPVTPSPAHADVVARFIRAWETGDFDDFARLLADDAILTMPPWEYWLDGKASILATMLSPGTWDGPPRADRYRILPTSMNADPAGLAYVRGPDNRYHPVCLTVLSLSHGLVSSLTTFVLPDLFTSWGFPPFLD